SDIGIDLRGELNVTIQIGGETAMMICSTSAVHLLRERSDDDVELKWLLLRENLGKLLIVAFTILQDGFGDARSGVTEALRIKHVKVLCRPSKSCRGRQRIKPRGRTPNLWMRWVGEDSEISL